MPCPSKSSTTVALALTGAAAVGYFIAKHTEWGKCPFTCKDTSSGSRPEGSLNDETRKYLIGGNWKCNGTAGSVEALVKILNEAGPIPSNVEVVVGVPAIHLSLVISKLREDIQVAAQDCGVNEKCGAFTGEICASQLIDLGVTWVIIGHSERREGFGMVGEDNELVAKKTKVAIDAGLKVQFCIGEKKEEREAGITMDVCSKQLQPLAKKLKEEDWANISIAYEPVWAIGTGLTATPKMAQETQAAIRAWLFQNVSPMVAKNVRIQYGGSMKGENVKDLLAQPDIDGGLIGGASLTADFVKCINGAPSP